MYEESPIRRISKEGETKSYIAAITHTRPRGSGSRREFADLYVIDKNNNRARSVMGVSIPSDGYLKVISMEENNGILIIEYEGYEYQGIDHRNRNRIHETKTFIPEDFTHKKDSLGVL